MLVFPAIGLLLWIAFLLAVFVISGIVWAFCHLVLGILILFERPQQKKVASVKRSSPPVQRHPPNRVPPPATPRTATPVRKVVPRPAPTPPPSDIWPKWTPAHRRYVDEELALWQQQFDTLSSRK